MDNLEFINQSRYKWTEILLKNYDYGNIIFKNMINMNNQFTKNINFSEKIMKKKTTNYYIFMMK